MRVGQRRTLSLLDSRYNRARRLRLRCTSPGVCLCDPVPMGGYAIGCVLVPVGGRASVLVAVLVFKF